MPIPSGSLASYAPPTVAANPGDLITEAVQLEWAQTLLVGDGTEFFVSDLQGWDEMPPIDSGNVPRAGRHGSWAGRAYAQERTVTVEFGLHPESGTTDDLRAYLRSIPSLSESGTESTLVVKDSDGPPLLAWGQLTRRATPMSQGFRRSVTGVAMQWVCSDPRRYSLAEHTTEILAPVLTGFGGLTYPLTYPLDYGPPAETGTDYLTNAGDADTSPLIVIRGPVTRPRVVNQTTGRVLEADLTVAAGEDLVIDTNAGTVLLSGGDRSGSLTSASCGPEVFTLVPGPNAISLRGTFPVMGSAVTITWRDATW
jgi:hypothetical protein